MKVRITKIFKADISHQLGTHSKDAVWVENTYGKCRNLHGHSIKIELTLEGPVDVSNGMVLNFNLLKEVFQGYYNEIDHNHLNDFLPIPTAENLAVYLFNELKQHLSGLYPEVMLYSVRIWETDTAYAEVVEGGKF
ncbi:MAG: 6-carboxytetrahydropterin synthase [Nanoarchaeota archaeon]